MKTNARILAWAAAAFAAWPAVASADPVTAYFERAVMSAAQARCGLFAPGVAAALAASEAQARGAVLRSGKDRAAVALIRARAVEKAAAVDCASSDMRVAAGRITTAFEGYSRLGAMDFPGDVASWRASRRGAWGLVQEARFGDDRMTFGLARGAAGVEVLVASATFADGAVPYGARILVRDPGRASAAYLAKGPLSARAAGQATARVFLAQGRQGGGPVAFTFPRAAETAISELDPREAVTVEFLFAGRAHDTVRRAYVEAGDFSAGQAFLSAARR